MRLANDRRDGVAAVKFDVFGVPRLIEPDVVVVAGFAARDAAGALAHARELAALGVRAPTEVPCFWRLPPYLATQTERLDVAGASTSGEVEACLIVDGDDVLVTVASDHTDRALEAHDLAASKRVCPKVIGTEAWPLDQIGPWDELELRSWIADGGERVAYQQGSLAELLAPGALLERLPFARPRCFLLSMGTVAVVGGVRPALRFEGELADPARGRAVRLGYDIVDVDPIGQDGSARS